MSRAQPQQVCVCSGDQGVHVLAGPRLCQPEADRVLVIVGSARAVSLGVGQHLLRGLARIARAVVQARSRVARVSAAVA